MSELATDVSDATTVLCVSCEYDLRGMPPEARCPECGAPVERSRQHHDAILANGEAPLWMSLPAWLRKMGIGCALALGSAVALIVATVLWTNPWANASKYMGIAYAGMALAILSDTLRIAALWLLGSREPAARQGALAARLIRAGAMVQALAFARSFLWNPPFAVHRIIAIVETVLMASVTALVWARLHRLARRSRSPVVTQSAERLRWLLPAFMVMEVIFFSSIPMAAGGSWVIKPQAIVGETFALATLPLEMLKGASPGLVLIFWVPALAITLIALATLAGMMFIFFREARASAAGWDRSADVAEERKRSDRITGDE